MENFNALQGSANAADLIAASAQAGSAPDPIPVEAPNPVPAELSIDAPVKTSAYSPAATKLKFASRQATDAKRTEGEGQVEAQSAPAPAQPEQVSVVEEAAVETTPVKDAATAASTGASAGASSGVVLASGGLLGLGLVGAAVSGGGGGGGGKDVSPPANGNPVAVTDIASATEGGAIVSGSVATNDSDPDGNSLTFALSAPVAGLVFNRDGSYIFDPSDAAYEDLGAGDSRIVVANYTVIDGRGGSASSTLTITVAGVNDAPVASGDAYVTAEDTALVIAAAGVLANDSDADGDALSAVLVSGPANGTLTLNADGSFTYIPNANYHGADSFTYRASDGTADSAPVTVNLTVTPVNDAPVAAGDSYVTAGNTALVIAAAGVLANDSDADGDTLSALLVSGPANGTLTLNANGSFTYTPNTNYHGTDSFTYRASDDTADSAPVTVSLTVTPINEIPVAVADSYATNEDATLTVAAAAGVLANDSDADGDALSAVLVSGPANGTLTLNFDGSFTYIPNANYHGADSFTYRASDGIADGNTVSVSLTVNPINDAPVAVADSYAINEDTTLNVAAAAGVLANDSDADGDTLSAIMVTGPANGTLTLNANGSFTYIPNANYHGADSFTYKVDDGTVHGNTVTVSLSVNPINDAPVAVADSYAINEDTTLTVAAASGVLANDSDVDGDTFRAVLVTGPANGTLTLNADGSFTYIPNANYHGADGFTYKVDDGTVDGNMVTVSLTVNPVNDAPVAVTDSYAINEDGTLTVAAAAGVLANDSDADGDALSAALVTGPANGTLTLNADGSFTYIPNANYHGADSFTYRANDGAADGNTVTVSLTVNAINDAPVAVADSYTIDEDTTLTVAAAAGVLANDSDVDGDVLTATLVTGPANASTFTLNPNGSFTYVPTANYNGADSFTYKVNDGTIDGNTVTVSLTVNPVNDAPVANDDPGTVGEDDILVVNAAGGLLANDTDVDAGTTLVISAVNGGAGNVGSQITLASGALLTVNADGSYSYDPNGQFEALRPGETDTDTFSYTTTDGSLTDTATVTVTINGANEVPVAGDDSFGMAGNTPITLTAAQLLGNDSDPDGLASDLTITGVSAGTNGTIVDNGDGTFTFTPTTGYSGTASFSYTVTDADGDTDTATVTLNVTDPVWYVNIATGSDVTGDGSYANPFATLAPLSTGGSADALDNANDTIFVYNTGTYTSGIVLENGQRLIGDGEAFTVNGISIGSSAGNTTINYSGFGVQLASGNSIAGFNLVGTSTAAVGIVDGGGTVGNLTVSNVAISGQGQIIDVDQGGTLAVALNSATSTGSSVNSGGVIDLTGVSGSFTVNGLTSITGTHAQFGIDISSNSGLAASFLSDVTLNTGAQTAVSLTSNTNSSFAFAPVAGGAGVDITTTSGNGIRADGNATMTLTIEGSGNTITSGTGTALAVTGVTIGADGLTFQSISKDGAGVGISLSDTGSLGGLHVTGTGGDAQNGSGGTITNATTGINLVNTSHVQLNQMDISLSANDAIFGSGVTNFSLNGSSLLNNGNDAGSNGIDFGSSAVSPYATFGGTFTVTNSAFEGSSANHIYLGSNAGTLAVNVSNNSLQMNSNANGNDGLLIQSYGSADITANVTNNLFAGHRGDHFQAANGGGGNLHVNFVGNNLVGGHANSLGQGITIGGSVTSTGRVDYNVSNNTISGAIGSAITISGSGGVGSSYNGTIANNTIGAAGEALSGSAQGAGIAIGTSGTTTHTVAVTNNTIREVYDTGINVNAGDAATLTILNLTIHSNVIETSSHAFSRNAILINSGTTNSNIYGYADALTMRLNIGGAAGLENILTSYNGFEDIRLRHRIDTRVELLGYGGAPNDLAAVAAYLNGRNPGATSLVNGGASFAGGRPDDGIYGTGSVPMPTAFLRASAPADEQAGAGSLTQADLDRLVGAAIDRWAGAGAGEEQLAAMRATAFDIADLNGLKLAASDQGTILIDRDAAGHGWFVDTTPYEDTEFGATNGNSTLSSSYDLLTVLMHELGHQIGLEDGFAAEDSGALMFSVLEAGTRVVPEAAEDSPLANASLVHTMGWWEEGVDLESGGGVAELLSALGLESNSAGSIAPDVADLSFAFDPSFAASAIVHHPIGIDERVI